MSTDTSTQNAQSPDRRFTATLLILSGYTVFAAAILWRVDGLPTAVRIPLALPILLFAPGYAVVTALVPVSLRTVQTSTPADVAEDPVSRTGLVGLERVTLAVVTSIALVPIVALSVNAVAGINLGYILAIISALTVGASTVAILRRRRGEPTVHSRTTRSLRDAIPTDGITIVAVVVAILLVGSSVAVSLTETDGTQEMTEFYVGTTTDEGGFVASGYPQSFTLGEEKPYLLQIRSHASEPQQYEIVAVLRSEDSSTGTTSVTELGRTTTTVQPGETATVRYPIAPDQAGDDLTLQFLLYRGDAPQVADPTTAHRMLELSIEVSDGS